MSDDRRKSRKRGLRVPADEVPRGEIIPPDAAPTYVEEDEFETKTSVHPDGASLSNAASRAGTMAVADEDLESSEAAPGATNARAATDFDVDIVAEEADAGVRREPPLGGQASTLGVRREPPVATTTLPMPARLKGPSAPPAVPGSGPGLPPPIAPPAINTPTPKVPPPPPSAPPPPPAGKSGREAARPWFEEVFDEDYLRTLPFMTPQATRDEAVFVAEALGAQAGATLLDLGCGYGRHAMELAARGYQMVGLDLSLPLLLRGADEAQRRGLHINFVQGDMRSLDFSTQFDGAYCWFSTFGYFDDEHNRKTLHNVAQCLRPGARFVLDVLNRDYVVRDLPTRVMWDGDGCVVMEEVDFNYYSSRIQSHRTVLFHDGRQLEQRISLRAYSLHEIGKLLQGAGLDVVEVSGSTVTRGRFLGPMSRQAIVVAERRA